MLQFSKDYVDTGDFIEVTGTLFTTKAGQESILVTGVEMLSKALLPLPDKYHGIQDEELLHAVNGIWISLLIQSCESFLKRRQSFGMWSVYFER